MQPAISEDLSTIYDILSAIQPGATKSDHYARIADRLSKIAYKTRPWTGSYVQSVIAGTVQPGAVFCHAVELLAASIDGTPPEFAEAEPVTVHANPANVQAGALVLGCSIQCAHPPCTVIFIPVVPWGKYCPAHRDPKSRKDTHVNP